SLGLRLLTRLRFPYTTLFRSVGVKRLSAGEAVAIPHNQYIESAGFPISNQLVEGINTFLEHVIGTGANVVVTAAMSRHYQHVDRSEEHTSELQSRENLVCRLL